MANNDPYLLELVRSFLLHPGGYLSSRSQKEFMTLGDRMAVSVIVCTRELPPKTNRRRCAQALLAAFFGNDSARRAEDRIPIFSIWLLEEMMRVPPEPPEKDMLIGALAILKEVRDRQTQ